MDPFSSPRAPSGIGHGAGWPGSRSDSRHHHSGWRRKVDRERDHSWPGRGVSRFATLLRTSMPSFGGFSRQSRRSFRFTDVPHLPHLAKTTTPLRWKILPPVDAHRSQARMQSTFLHFISIVECCQTSFWGSSSSYWLAQNYSRRVESWQTRRQRDEQRISRLPRNARRWQQGTQLLLAANLKALGALGGASLAPSHNLMRGQPDALFQWCMLAMDRDMGHLNGLVGITARPCAGCRWQPASAPSWPGS